jgi:glycosyltransferase involved in cell wall biosynthesis
MACGTPVVSTDCIFGPSEIIENGVDGLLCRLDVEDLASKMEWMITHEKERKEMGIRAHQSVVRYRRENVMKEWERAYLNILQY